MKKILYFVAALAAASFITTMGTSCKFAPDQHDGDTVAASEFYPIDTSAAHAKKMAKIAAIKNGKDSVGIYYVGSNSTKDLIELVSYPSRRDTMMYSKPDDRSTTKRCNCRPPCSRPCGTSRPAPLRWTGQRWAFQQ